MMNRKKISRRLVALGRSARQRLASDRGAITAEYAVAVMAAVGFAGVLVVVLRSGEVNRLLQQMIRRALAWR